MEIKDENLQIKITFPKEKGKVLAYASLRLKTVEYGDVTLKRFVIWNSDFIHPRFQDRINITAPRMRGRHGYLELLFFEDEKRWFLVESRIYDAYHLAISRHSKKEERVNPDDVPL